MTGKPNITPLDILIGQAAKNIRTKKKIGQEEASQAIGVSIGMLSLMENGKRAWSKTSLSNAANFYNVPISLLTGEEKKEVPEWLKPYMEGLAKVEPSTKKVIEATIQAALEADNTAKALGSIKGNK